MKLPYLRSPVFWGVALLKLVVGSICTSYYLSNLFIPFIRYFVFSGYSNPWNEFLQRGILDAFPYSSVMVGVLSFPTAVASLVFGASIPGWMQLLLMRLPMMAADVVIYLILCHWFDRKWKNVLFLYWCSPVLFYISYVHGQIDVIPTALLLVSLGYTVRLEPVRAGIFLGLGLGTKFHLALTVPLCALYLYRAASTGSDPWNRPLKFLASVIGTLVLVMGPWFSSPGYQALVLGAKEGRWLLDLAIPMPQGVSILICPLAVAILLLHVFSYRQLTKDVLVLYLGLLYTIFITLVQPMPGWAYWSIPFLIYFLIRHSMPLYVPFWTFNFFYLLYFVLFAPGQAAAYPALRNIFPNGDNLTFTFMQASLGLVAVWVYRVGVRAYVRYRANEEVVTVGIGGDSASGKHTLAETLAMVLGSDQVTRLHGDDYHRWPRHHEAWNRQTHLDPRSNYFREPLKHIQELKSGLTVEKPTYDHKTGQFTPPAPVHSNRFIIFEGLHPFVFQRLRDTFDIKIFMATDPALRREWKLKRDTEERGQTAAQVSSSLEKREEDSEKFIQPQEDFADWVIQYEAASDQPTVPNQVRHRITSSALEIETLVDALSECKAEGLSVTWTMEPDLRRQQMDISGQISQVRVTHIGSRLYPDLQELFGARPAWKSGFAGIHQLIFLALLYSRERR